MESALSQFLFSLFARRSHHSRTNPSEVQSCFSSWIRPFTMGAQSTEEFACNLLFWWAKKEFHWSRTSMSRKIFAPKLCSLPTEIILNVYSDPVQLYIASSSYAYACSAWKLLPCNVHWNNYKHRFVCVFTYYIICTVFACSRKPFFDTRH